MGEAITRHSLRPLRSSRAKLFAALGRECAAGPRRCVYYAAGKDVWPARSWRPRGCRC